MNKGHDINAFQAKRNMREGEPNTAISSQHSIMAIKRVTHNATWLFSPRISGDRFLFALQGGSWVFLAGVCERGLSHEALWCPDMYIGEVKMCGLVREFGSRAKSCLHLDILRVYFLGPDGNQVSISKNIKSLSNDTLHLSWVIIFLAKQCNVNFSKVLTALCF